MPPTVFLDVRLSAVGGDLAATVATMQGTSQADYTGITLNDLDQAIRGNHVLLATHGFNVDRLHGIESLHNWHTLLQIPAPFAFVGILWPGDSIWAHGLDYPEEPLIANDAGKQLLAPFIDTYFGSAASISFASHSLGARVILETIANLKTPVRRVLMMAGAIDDNCLNSEFQSILTRVGVISLLASRRDEVLNFLFPLGNLPAGIIAEGHPWWRTALGHSGPSNPRPANLQAPFQIPFSWGYGHHHYLETDPLLAPPLATPLDVPAEALLRWPPEPANSSPGWQPNFSAAFASTRFH